MPTDVIMPKVDMVMDEGTIVHWYKAEGDPVQSGEPLFDIETDKATMVIEAPASGVLGAISAPVDTTVPVATVIAQIYGADEGREADVPQQAPAPVIAPAPPRSQRTPVDPMPASTAVASMPPLQMDVSGAAPRPRATPIARKLAREHGLDLVTIEGRGPKGRIGKNDVLQELAGDGLQVPGARKGANGDGATQATTTPRSPNPEPLAADTRYPTSDTAASGRFVPLAGIRRIVAQRMAASATIPQFTLTVDVDMTAARELRERLSYRPSFTAIVARAVAGLLPRHPTLNASFRDDAIWFHTPVHLGIALDSDGDLLVPVIRDAERRSLREIDEALKQMRDRAAAKQLPPSELQGSTFSISNLGMFGIDRFTALVNPPEAAILAVGQIIDKPIGVKGELVLRPLLTLTLSADHRVTDGATAARFLQDVRAALEEPYLML